MGTFSVTKSIEFDAAHRLFNYAGKCSNLHGHRYTAEFTFACARLNSDSMVIDFGVIKGGIGKWLDDNWDHSAILHKDDTLLSAAAAHHLKPGRFFGLDASPTAEIAICPDMRLRYAVRPLHVLLADDADLLLRHRDIDDWCLQYWKGRRVLVVVQHDVECSRDVLAFEFYVEREQHEFSLPFDLT